MTIREIADTAGCSEKTVKRVVSGLWPEKMQHGKVTRFTLSEANKLMEVLPKKNMVGNSGHLSSVSATTKESTLTPKDMELIAGIVSAVFANLETRMGRIESRVAERAALLPPPQIKPRDHVNQIVRKYAEANGIDFPTAWGDLYREFGYRTNSAPKVAAKNRGMGVLDYLESEGLIETLEAVALEWAK